MCKIMIIDDDKDFAEGAAAMLQTRKHDTIVVLDADTALETLTEEVDVILSDVCLSDETCGAELVKEIKEIVDIPVVLITAYPSLTTAVESVRNDAYDYLQKPCDPEVMIKVIETAAEKTLQKRKRKKAKENLITELQSMKSY